MSNVVANPETVFEQLVPPRDALLLELEAEADREDIPIVGPVVGGLLNLLARLMRAQTLLEVGTATGYSAIWLGRAVENTGGQLTALEIDEQMAARARHNIGRAGLDSAIAVTVCDAVTAMARMNASYDLIFIDIEKKDYLRILPDCYRLLKIGGLLIADNVAFQDAQPFNRAIGAQSGWQPIHLYAHLPRHSPEYDGLCLALKVE